MATIITYILIFSFSITQTKTTRDMNRGEMEYLSDHLKDDECKLLIFNLMRYENLNEVPRVECIVNLFHWDRTYGRGETSEDLVEPLHQIGRGDLAAKLTEFVIKEKKFQFEHSPFFKGHVAEDPHTTDPAEREFKEGETIEQIVDEFNKETDKADMGFVQKATGYAFWQLLLMFIALVMIFALVFNIAFGDSQWFKDLFYYIKNEVPVYCCGYTSRPFDKLHYDPDIHLITENVL